MKTLFGDDKKAGRLSFASDDARWNAVVHRNHNADGKFLYSVKTTGVYCRPSCNGRLARRENVQFHSSCEADERAGFRPCKRCQPNGKTLAEQRGEAVAAACRAIEASEGVPNLDTLAKSAGMSRFHFHRVFKSITGLTPKAFATGHRSERMREELPKQRTVTDAIYEAGFKSNGRFYARSTQVLGMKPASFRRGGAGTTIRFAVGKCSLGSILVAASDAGICAISIGDDPEALVRGLQDRFPKARLIRGDKTFEQTVADVVGFIEAPKFGLDLPLDIRGTVFQQRVWRELQKIPVGSTASYTEVAKRIGKPKAIRAVARACAVNPIAVAIPCHRVLRENGSLSGYRWGVERKRELLEREARWETSKRK